MKNSKVNSEEISKKKYSALLLSIGILLRCIVVFVIIPKIYGTIPHQNGDSLSYSLSGINLLEKGSFSFDLENQEAYYGRLPVYPLFYLINYIVFGAQNILIGLTISQIILDAIIPLFIFYLIKPYVKLKAAFTIALLYSILPFSFFWLPLVGTEAFALFIAVCVLYIFYTAYKSRLTSYYIILGLLLGVAVLTRAYFILLPFTFLLVYIFNWRSISKKHFLITGIIALLTYLPWPIRNYIISEKIILIKSEYAGYNTFSKDVVEIRKWIYTFSIDSDNIIKSIANSSQDIELPQVIKEINGEKKINAAINLSRKCGTGIAAWGHKAAPTENCNDEVSEYFSNFRKEIKQKAPLMYYTKVPLLNLKKLFFKTSASFSESIVTKAFFYLRSFLLIIAIVICMSIGLRNPISQFALLFFFFQTILVCIYLRHLEMRYFLQADYLLYIAAGLVYIEFYNQHNKYFNFSKRKTNWK